MSELIGHNMESYLQAVAVNKSVSISEPYPHLFKAELTFLGLLRSLQAVPHMGPLHVARTPTKQPW